MNKRTHSIPVVILCGGKGVFVDDSQTRKSKSLIDVSGAPLVAHVVNHYLRAGFSKFILSCGYQIEQIQTKLKSLYHLQPNENKASATQTGNFAGQDLSVSFINSGLDSPTGERIKLAQPLLDGSEHFCVTYSDTLSEVDLNAMLDYHITQNRIATLLAARIPTRFRILGLRPGDDRVRGFSKRPVIQNDFINGGFYFFKKAVFDNSYLGAASHSILEETVLENLVSAGELVCYRYEGPWHYLDCERDIIKLEEIVKLNQLGKP